MPALLIHEIVHAVRNDYHGGRSGRKEWKMQPINPNRAVRRGWLACCDSRLRTIGTDFG